MTEQVQLLTARERECLRLVDRHFSSKQIARELGMSKTSVDTYCDRARRKLGVNDRYHAARLLADHERESGAAPGSVLIASGQDTVRTDRPPPAWSGEASSGGETHEALEWRGSAGVGEPGPAPQTRDRGLRGKVAETLAAGGVDARLRLGPAGASADGSG
ncbi:MAG: helix-turn-helix transcriptional regulator, partial [Phenylobacterium sp.]|nr:helix-turn-helix transcriptional regulator [Phenylobacterium sp.]